jgi:GT2 family glycosyltransferase/glycosyltransferase involved in cell wall biosynthesis
MRFDVSSQRYIKLANTAFAAGKYEDALKLYEAVALEKPELSHLVSINISIVKNKIKNKNEIILNQIQINHNNEIHNLNKIKLLDKKELIDVIANSGFFNTDWYLREYQDVAANKKINPIDHFARKGLREKRNPGPNFDVKWYVQKYPTVIAHDINPVVHYELIGKSQGYFACDPNNKLTAWWSRLSFYQKVHDDISIDYKLLSNNKSPIVIIIPIFNAVKDLERCIRSVLLNTRIPFRLLLINDASTDPEVNLLLSRYEHISNIEIFQNTDNKGFTGTVNKGLALANKSDVVLLNSDTIVTPNWLVNLRLAAFSRIKVGTATAFSNNAGAFSVPNPGVENSIPIGYSLSDWARAINQSTPKTYPLTPTGHGFCMYIRNDCLEDVGLLDQESFPRGYGEENDFSMRGLRKGWQHVIAINTYIYHVKSASFGDEKVKLLKDGRAIIDKKYPEYTKMVREFMQRVDVVSARSDILEVQELILLERPKIRPRVLYVLSTKTGGTPQTNEDLMEALSERVDAFVLYCNSSKMDLYHYCNHKYSLVFTGYLDEIVKIFPHQSESYDKLIISLLIKYSIELVHIRHIAWHGLGLVTVAKNLGLPVIFSFHDFYTVCPTVKLLDNNLNYCGGNCTLGEGVCNWELWPKNDSISLKHKDIYEWRKIQESMLLKCDGFITTSPSAKEVILNTYPSLHKYLFNVISHGRDFPSFRKINKSDSPNPLKLLVPGNISKAKGGAVLEALSNIATEIGIEIHILGIVSSDVNVSKMIVHGAYERNDFISKVEVINPYIGCIFSVWPETYCHTLTELWASGVPVLAFDIGAVGERIRETGAGFLLSNFEVEEIVKFLNEIRSKPSQYSEALNQLTYWQDYESKKQGCTAMADKYFEMYKLFISVS